MIPTYAREYEKKWQRYDRHLRLRRSLDFPGRFLLERRTRYLADHSFVSGTDRQIQLRDEYRRVMLLVAADFPFVADHLRRTDIRRIGAKEFERVLDAEDEARRATEEKDRLSDLDATGSEAYDFLAWREGRRVSMSGANKQGLMGGHGA